MIHTHYTVNNGYLWKEDWHWRQRYRSHIFTPYLAQTSFKILTKKLYPESLHFSPPLQLPFSSRLQSPLIRSLNCSPCVLHHLPWVQSQRAGSDSSYIWLTSCLSPNKASQWLLIIFRINFSLFCSLIPQKLELCLVHSRCFKNESLMNRWIDEQECTKVLSVQNIKRKSIQFGE